MNCVNFSGKCTIDLDTTMIQAFFFCMASFIELLMCNYLHVYIELIIKINVVHVKII